MSIAAQIAKDPVAFMTNNILMMSAELNGLAVTGGVRPFSVVESKAMKAYKNGQPIKVYALKKMTSGGDQLNAYWCPYEQNKAGTTVLSNRGPGLMFTAAMDGCTFGAGARSTDGAVRVAHVNMGAQAKPEWGGVQNQRRLQGNVIRGLLGTGKDTTVQDPNTYYTKTIPTGGLKIATTTFGVRTDKLWVFYSHSWYSASSMVADPDNVGQQVKSHSLNWMCCELLTASL